MRPIRRILVAVKEPLAKSQPAVEKAVQLARATGAQLELFHSISTPLCVDTLTGSNATLAKIENGWRDQFVKQLDALAARVGTKGLQIATHVQWDFPAYEAILRRAQRTKVDLIVAERHEGKHVAPSLLRLTDWELLRQSPIPVLLVKSTKPYQNPVVLAAIDPMHAFAKPTGLDGEILKAGSLIGSALRGTLHVVHAYVPMPANIPQSEYFKPDIAKRLDLKAKESVEKSFLSVAIGAGIKPARRHLVGEHPIDAIPETVRKTQSAIVVMGAISRSGLKRFFIGNTAEQLLDKLNCDVLIVKPPRFPTRIQRASRGARLIASAPMPM